MSTPDQYGFRTLFLSADLDAPTCTVLIEAGAEPDALQLDLMQDAIVGQTHVLFAAQDRAALAAFAASFKRLAEQATTPRH